MQQGSFVDLGIQHYSVVPRYANNKAGRTHCSASPRHVRADRLILYLSAFTGHFKPTIEFFTCCSSYRHEARNVTLPQKDLSMTRLCGCLHPLMVVSYARVSRYSYMQQGYFAYLGIQHCFIVSRFANSKAVRTYCSASPRHAPYALFHALEVIADNHDGE
jgi:hypothetical protein